MEDTQIKVADRTTKKYLRCNFTDADIIALASDLAQANNRRAAKEEEKKAANSQFKSELDSIEAEISRASIAITQGWDMKHVECDVFFNEPEKGSKRIVRKDTGEQIAIEAMDSVDLQTDLPFDDDGCEAFEEEPAEEEEAPKKRGRKAKRTEEE